jgi:hypothetical protein
MRRLRKWRLAGNGETDSVIITVLSTSETRIDVSSNTRVDVSGNIRVTAGV